MARSRSPNRSKAFDIFKENSGNITNREIANILEEDEKVIAVWKSRDKWNNKCNVVQQSKKSCTTKERGGQPGNKNSKGGTEGNKNAEKFGFFSKYLPEETKEIFDAISDADPLDLLWHQIQLAYTAIIRAQSLMHVSDKNDLTKELKKEKEMTGDKADSWEKEYELQFAWDKQANFMQAQARQQATLNSLIKQYDEMLHKNWDKASEEQKLRISKLRYEVSQLSGGNDGDTGIKDFLKAVKPTQEDIEAMFDDDEVIEDAEEIEKE